jgi:hypothetical protein
MTTSGLPIPTWLGWTATAAPFVTSWEGFLLVAALPALGLLREVVRNWQRHGQVKMILEEGSPGTVVASKTEQGRKAETFIVLVGNGDLAPGQQMVTRFLR